MFKVTAFIEVKVCKMPEMVKFNIENIWMFC